MKTAYINSLTISHNHEDKNQKLKKLKQLCNDFESEILIFYLKQALDSKNSLYPKSPGEDIYKSMYQETLSKSLSGNFGYSELLYNFLKNKV